MPLIKYDYQLDLELELDLNFFNNIDYQFNEIIKLLSEAKKPNLSSFEFANVIDEIISKEDNIVYIVKEARKLGIEYDFIKDFIKELDAEKKRIIIAKDNKYG